MQPDENPNAETITGLRELADWLEAHPELPAVGASAHAHIHSDDAREVLTTMADALGDRAEERIDSIGYVAITGAFGPVTVNVYAKPELLGAKPRPEPAYEPIIVKRPAVEA